MYRYRLKCLTCDEAFVQTDGTFSFSTAAAFLTNEAKNLGWKIYDCGAHCPKCQAKHKNDKPRNYSVKFDGTKLIRIKKS